MTYRFAYRRYRLPFRAPLRTAHGLWAEREGLIVRLEDEAGRVGWGEAAPIPEFGTETIAEAAAACEAFGDRMDETAFAALPSALGCTRSALTAALEQPCDSGGDPGPAYIAVAGLLPAGRAVLAAAGPKVEAGFRAFKWKVGAGDPKDEMALLDDVFAALPPGSKLRLDANGAWDRRTAERWLERCADHPVEFIEQPVAPKLRGAQDLLLGLARDYPTPLALDESLTGEGDIERWLAAGWPGIFVVKPALIGGVAGALALLLAARSSVVFSSALETSIGAQAALRTAFAWKGTAFAAGFGVWPLFADPRFDGPAATPFIHWEDVKRIKPEAVWTALS